MHHDDLLATIQTLLGSSSDAEAERATEAVLETMGERLEEAAAVRLATFLSEPLSAALLRRRVPGRFSRTELVDRIARREGISPGFAIEHAIVVCEALTAHLPEGEVTHLHDALPLELAALFTRHPRASHPHRPEPRAHEPDHTLAGGRPGSRHPLSEAHPERAQSQSVARSDDPHAETKLSSAAGLTQEREGESLATGRPGSKRPLASSR